MDLKKVADTINDSVDGAYQRPTLWMLVGAFLGLVLWGISQADEEQRNKKSHQFFRGLVQMLINL